MSKSLQQKMLSKPAKRVGDTLADIWSLIFGKISLIADKQNLEREYELELFKRELEEKLNGISEDRLKEPDFQVIALTLDASKCCIFHQELRALFANLIASSLDKELCSQVHPSFADIIKQMSPLDAKNIILFKKKEYQPICNYRVHYKDGSYDDHYKNVFLSNRENQDVDLQSLSMSSLERLGIISINFSIEANDIKYEGFEETKEYIELNKAIEDRLIPRARYVEIVKGVVELTPYGKAFVKSCT